MVMQTELSIDKKKAQNAIAKAMADVKALRTKAEAENREFTAEEKKTREELLENAKKLKSKLAEIAEEESIEASMVGDTEERREKPPITEGTKSKRETKDGPFKSFGEQLASVINAGGTHHLIDPRLYEVGAISGMGEKVDSEGGYLVQQDFTTELMNGLFATGQLAGLCRRTPIGPGSNGLVINQVTNYNRADGYRYGAVAVYWKDEGETPTAGKAKFEQLTMKLQKLIGIAYLTDELIQDVVALQSYVTEVFTEEFSFKLDDGIYNGSGANAPLGILNSACKVSVAKETGQSASTIVAANVYKMYAAMPARSLGNAVWCINQNCWPQLFQLSQAVGVGGVPLFVPSGGINQAPAGTLLGRPILPIEQAATLGTVGDIAFADFGQYRIIDKGGVESAVSIHVKFIYDELTLRFTLRINGQPMWSTYITPYKGTTSYQSPFVFLATRA